MRIGAAVLAAGLLLASAAFACALPPSVILTLPTGQFILAAAVTVALTAMLGAATGSLPVMQARMLWQAPDRLAGTALSYLGFLLFLGLLGIGFLGAEDPMHNLLPLVFWTGVWVALPLASLIFGNLWRVLNPWYGPVRMARLLIGRTGKAGLARWQQWPAVLGLLGFSWFQSVSVAPSDPGGLAWLALGYWAVIFGLAVAEGEDWLQQGEFLSVFFAMIASIAPFWRQRSGGTVRTFIGWPGTQVLAMPPLSRSGAAFLTLALSALTFDGLSETFWWMGLLGQNPLEFVGRSAVIVPNTAGLLGVWGLTALVIRAVLRASTLAAGPVMLAFLAIAAGYHAAHNLVLLLTTGQYTLAALNDPLFRGDAWLGLAPFYVSFGFLSNPAAVTAIYAAQFVAILAAHLLAVVLALRLAGPAGIRAHLPLTGMMVAYTVLGLWLLSTARGA